MRVFFLAFYPKDDLKKAARQEYQEYLRKQVLLLLTTHNSNCCTLVVCISHVSFCVKLDLSAIFGLLFLLD